MMCSLSEQERSTLDAITRAYNEFIKLPIQHPADQGEFTFHIHALQNMIMARVYERCEGLVEYHKQIGLLEGDDEIHPRS